MRINPKFSGPLIGFFVALGMSFVMSFVMVAINIGFAESFLSV